MSKIIIIGSTIQGEATGKGFADRGHTVIFCDSNSKVLEKLRNEGWNVCTLNMLEHQAHDADFFMISTESVNDFTKLNIFRTALMRVGQALRDSTVFPVVVIQNNVLPGTTRKIALPLLERHSGKRVGQNVGLCFQPRYLREAHSFEDFQHPPFVLIGAFHPACGKKLESLYSSFRVPMIQTSIEEAEMQKYIHTLFNATKISFFSEMRMVCERIGVNADTIFPLVVKSAEGQRNPRYGTLDFGPLRDGHLPQDIKTFLHWAKKNVGSMPFLNALIKVNEQMYIAKKRRKG